MKYDYERRFTKAGKNYHRRIDLFYGLSMRLQEFLLCLVINAVNNGAVSYPDFLIIQEHKQIKDKELELLFLNGIISKSSYNAPKYIFIDKAIVKTLSHCISDLQN